MMMIKIQVLYVSAGSDRSLSSYIVVSQRLSLSAHSDNEETSVIGDLIMVITVRALLEKCASIIKRSRTHR